MSTLPPQDAPNVSILAFEHITALSSDYERAPVAQTQAPTMHRSRRYPIVHYNHNTAETPGTRFEAGWQPRNVAQAAQRPVAER